MEPYSPVRKNGEDILPPLRRSLQGIARERTGTEECCRGLLFVCEKKAVLVSVLVLRSVVVVKRRDGRVIQDEGGREGTGTETKPL